MNDYKEMVANLRTAGKWIKHDDGSEETYLLSVGDCAEIADAIEQLVRERDAAVEDIGWNCLKCKHYNEKSPNYGYTEDCETCGCYPWFDDEAEIKWEWRGVQE